MTLLWGGSIDVDFAPNPGTCIFSTSGILSIRRIPEGRMFVITSFNDEKRSEESKERTNGTAAGLLKHMGGTALEKNPACEFPSKYFKNHIFGRWSGLMEH